MNFRKANLNDIDELVRLRIEFMKENLVNANELLEFDNEAIKSKLVEYFKQNILDGEFVAWLAMYNDEIIGTSGLCFYELPPTLKNVSGKVAYIMNMYTVKKYRSQGVATELFYRIVDEAKMLGYKKIVLHATELGKPLYKKYGFKETNGEMSLSI